jgi:hypothetical protein
VGAARAGDGKRGAGSPRKAAETWFDSQPDLDPQHLFFVDESGLSTKTARLRGWATRGERCRASVPHGHWKTITFVGALTLSGYVAPMLLDGPMNGECKRPGNLSITHISMNLFRVRRKKKLESDESLVIHC